MSTERRPCTGPCAASRMLPPCEGNHIPSGELPLGTKHLARRLLFPGTTGDQPRTARLLKPFRCTERRCCASDLSARALDSKPGLLQDLLCPTQGCFVSRPESCLRIPWAPRGLHEPAPDVSAVREPSQWALSPRNPQGVGNNDTESGAGQLPSRDWSRGLSVG